MAFRWRYREGMNWLRARVGDRGRRFLDWYDLYMADHGYIRAVWPNIHKVSANVWRSGQPSPQRVAWWAREHGIKTIVNLRGPSDSGYYRLEKEACEAHGITLIDLTSQARKPPKPGMLFRAKEVFDQAEYPLLMHCKSGADRAGFMSVYYRYIVEGRSFEDSFSQLAHKYGHVRSAKTGIIDFFWEQYRDAHEKDGISFFDWVNEIYDRDELAHKHKTSAWANILVDKILRREG